MAGSHIFIATAALFWATAAGAQLPAPQTAPEDGMPSGIAAQGPARETVGCTVWSDRTRMGPTYRQLAQDRGQDAAESWLRQQTAAFNLHTVRMGRKAAPCPT